MRCARSTARAVLVLLGVAGAFACKGPAPDPDDPGVVARQLFGLAAGEPEREQLDSLFGPELDPASVVSLLEALDQLAGSAPPEVLGVETAPDGREAFVDLAAELPGGGQAGYNVKLRRLDGDGWRIAWFQGPGLEWPQRRQRGAGLSTSAPPESPSDGW